MHQYPTIIQGGMGAGVSNWRLANAVSRTGQMGVVSGTALDVVLARRLADGDPGGHMRRAMDAFPFPAMARRIWDRYWSPTGKASNAPYPSVPMQTVEGPRESTELCMVSNFVEVFLAREGHNGPVGINYLEKIQLPHLPSLYGAMLAGVHFVLMGAGIPLKIPGAMDRLALHQAAEYPVHVAGAPDQNIALHFDPRDFMERDLPPLTRPDFLAIISSYTLGVTLLKKSNGKVNGLIIETQVAGGHNAPPRGKLQLSATGEPIYGERDAIDIEKIRGLGVPFWMAGGYGHPGMLVQALEQGATGIQVGTAFAFCRESGLRDDYKQALLSKALAGNASVFTDPTASPTGFPFKVAQLEGTCSQQETYAARPRICDLGFLRGPYLRDDGAIGYRCPSEPVSLYRSKGGSVEETVGRKCICNALIANIGHPQVRSGRHWEPGLVTAGDDLASIGAFLPTGRTSYSAEEVIATLLSQAGPLPTSSSATPGQTKFDAEAAELCLHAAVSA